MDTEYVKTHLAACRQLHKTLEEQFRVIEESDNIMQECSENPKKDITCSTEKTTEQWD